MRALRGPAFLRYAGVAATWANGARHDADAFAGVHLLLEWMSGESFSDDLEYDLALRQIGTAKGVAIHRRVVIGRHVNGRRDVARQGTTECLLKWYPLALINGLDELCNRPLRDLNAQGIAIEACDGFSNLTEGVGHG